MARRSDLEDHRRELGANRYVFDTVAEELRRVADVAIAGDGEPTTPPEFPRAASVAREARDRLAPGVPLRLLTNATLFHKRPASPPRSSPEAASARSRPPSAGAND